MYTILNYGSKGHNSRYYFYLFALALKIKIIGYTVKPLTGVQFICVKLKISYIETSFKVRFKQDFGLFRVRFRQLSLYYGTY